jgi:hypothetical protein
MIKKYKKKQKLSQNFIIKFYHIISLRTGQTNINIK